MGDIILYKEDIDRLNEILLSIVNDTNLLSAFLINKDTRLLACQGTLSMFDMSALAALIVGSFSSTQAIAGLIGEKEFSTMSNCGKSKNLLISLVDDNTIIAAIFDNSIPFAKVSSSINNHIQKLKQVLFTINKNMESLFQETPLEMPTLSQEDVEHGIDNFFDSNQNINRIEEEQVVKDIYSENSSLKQNQEQNFVPPPPKTTPIAFSHSDSEKREYVTENNQKRENFTAKEEIPKQKIPVMPPSNTEHIYITSQNFLKNKAKEATLLNKNPKKSNIFANIFKRYK
jgi:predicted regulator of Ras-like GTPase activity (Roadblock/LC7/MglB family)